MVSVLMTAYNSARYIREAIESIINQTYEDWEMIIVDDGSADDTYKIIIEYAELHDITVVKLYRNIGHTNAMNMAMGLAKGEYLAWQDSDDISELTRLEEQIKLLELHPIVNLVSTLGITINEDGKRIKNWYTDRAQRKGVEEIQRNLLKDCWILCPSMMWRREVVNKIGYFNSKCYFSQDYNYFLRAFKHFTWRKVNKELYRFRKHSGSVRKKKSNTDWKALAIREAENGNYIPC